MIYSNVPELDERVYENKPFTRAELRRIYKWFEIIEERRKGLILDHEESMESCDDEELAHKLKVKIKGVKKMTRAEVLKVEI